MSGTLIITIVALVLVCHTNGLARNRAIGSYLETYVNLRELQDRNFPDSLYIYAGNDGELIVNFTAPIRISKKEELSDTLTNYRPEWDKRLARDWKKRLSIQVLLSENGGGLNKIENAESRFAFRKRLEGGKPAPRFERKLRKNKQTGKLELWGFIRYRLWFTVPDTLSTSTIVFKVTLDTRDYGSHTTWAQLEARSITRPEDLDVALGLKAFLYNENHHPQSYAFSDSAIRAGHSGWQLLSIGWRAARDAKQTERALEIFDQLYRETGSVAYDPEKGHTGPSWYRYSERDTYEEWRADLLRDMVEQGNLILPTQAFSTHETRSVLTDSIMAVLSNAIAPPGVQFNRNGSALDPSLDEVIDAETDGGFRKRLRMFASRRRFRVVVEGDPDETWHGSIIRDEVRTSVQDSFTTIRVIGYDSTGTLVTQFADALRENCAAPRLMIDLSGLRMQSIAKVKEIASLVAPGSGKTLYLNERVYETDSSTTASIVLPWRDESIYRGNTVIYLGQLWPAAAIDYLIKPRENQKIMQEGFGFECDACNKRFDVAQGIYILVPTATVFDYGGLSLCEGWTGTVSETDFFHNAVRKLMEMKP